ncbi:UDP-glucose--hexose-1-phosphate uridylyltransferase [Flagellimonas allohymeniacidonis]|uniref:Galactose-1-phosphate uridylyltransferase n=1 Tax=Flagellimonas allohymeniacidonis TaxID=2517819 RepID=A0A4Q8QJE5_9FLAO|nr:UDP-glucose--hexose-1-phosphate uridylyltransferase [Allomuricauda hymeniacidonis]TAI48356.1 UDP-glucose--hexose-1-phosphate uridylyltransferase [Allomuricauda hymeniacidonis]
MEQFNLENHPHRRYNPLTGEWVQVSPHRSKRPWQGQVEEVTESSRPRYDSKCFLCPGNTRANGIQNPDYQDTFSFVNDFSALLPEIPTGSKEEDSLFVAKSERGLCKVICFSPRHNLTIPEMDLASIKKVIDLWVKEYLELGSLDFINHVQIFENKGEMMGCSNPHPHGQIWAQESIPDNPKKKGKHLLKYFEKYKRSLLQDYVEKELLIKERILFENEHFVGLVPFWAIWPFEAMIISKRHITNILGLTENERTSLSDAYKRLTIMYDNLFGVSFPYSAGIHQSPTDGNEHPEWHIHMSFYPPLLRSATVKKFMVGYEMLASPQRDITPEAAARILKSLELGHYREKY